MCGEEFNRHGVRENHEQDCQGSKWGTCPYCLQVLSISNMARHKRKCALANEFKTEYRRVEKIGVNVTPSNVMCVVKNKQGKPDQPYEAS